MRYNFVIFTKWSTCLEVTLDMKVYTNLVYFSALKVPLTYQDNFFELSKSHLKFAHGNISPIYIMTFMLQTSLSSQKAPS